MSDLVRRSAAVLLVITFGLDLFAGLAWVGLALMGAGMFAMLGAMSEEMMWMAGDAQRSEPFTGLAASVGGGLAAYGVLVIAAGVLALLAASRLIGERPGRMVYAGSTAAVLADATSLALIGFHPFQVPGLLGGALGFVAGRRLMAPRASAETPPGSPRSATIHARPGVAPPSSRAGALLAGGAVAVGAALVGLAIYMQQAGPSDSTGATSSETGAGGGTSPERARPARETSPPLTTDGPVRGEVADLPFEPTRVYFENGRFVLHARDDLELDLHLSIDPDAVPEGLAIAYERSASAFDSPTIFVRRPQGGSSFGTTDIVQHGFRLRLETGALEDNRIPGRIELELPRTRLAGEFRAWVEGRLDIEPDLTRGGRSAFRYLAYHHLQRSHPDADIEIVDDTYRYQSGDATKRTMYGHTVVAWTLDGAERVDTFQLRTTPEGRWELVRALEPGRLPAAHPLVEPEADGRGRIELVAARHLEGWLREHHPDRVPWQVFTTGSRITKVGYAEVRARIALRGVEDPIRRRLYLRREDGEWRYVRDLADDERIDRDGKVVEKRE